MSSTVVILCPNGRRQTVHTTLNASLLSIIDQQNNRFLFKKCLIYLQILEEVCQKQSLDSKQYQLRHNKTILDLSLNLRYTNLPNNCKLEIEKIDFTRKEGKIKVRLELESGEKLISEFLPNESLYQVITIWKEKIQNDLNDSTKEPILIYIRNEFVGTENLKTVNLRKLGLTSGNAAFRLIFRDIGLIGHQPHVSNLLVSCQPKISNGTKKMNSAANVATQPVESPIVDKNSDPDETMDDLALLNVSTTSSTKECQNKNFVDETEQISCQNLDSMDVDNPEAQEVVSVYNKQLPSCSWSGSIVENAMEDKEGEEEEEANNVYFEPKYATDEEGNESLSSSQSSSEDDHVFDERASRIGEQYSCDVMGAARDVMDAVRDVILVACEALLSKMLLLWLRSIPCFNTTAATREALIEDRNAMLFDLEDIPPISHADLPDDFYKLDGNDITLLYQDLMSKCTDLQDKPLVTEKMRQNQKLMQLRKYKKCCVRIQFPDRIVLQGTFLPIEKILDVYDFVKSFLDEDISTFHLFTTPPKSILNLNSKLSELNLVPTALLYFGFNEKRMHYLRDEYLNNFSTLNAVTQSAFNSRNPNMEISVKNEMSSSPKRFGDSSAQSSQMKKIPRWFRKQ
ncbi:Tether containing UBX domain for GLUT4 [Nymphon striatum]|nr:Tether containing UBX domain for GLUT4 [Nymphon striatum]